ncbi:MAG: T9SS type A sorting domain-containing protein [Bacteroidia bacterium]
MKKLCLVLLLWVGLQDVLAQQVIPLPFLVKSDMCVVNDSLIYVSRLDSGLLVYPGFGSFLPVSFQLPITRIYALTYLNGDLWVGTASGLFRVNNGVVSQFSPTLSNFDADTVFSLAVTTNAVVAGTNVGLLVQQTGAWQRFDTSNSALLSNRVTRVKTWQNEIGIVADGAAYVVSGGQLQALNLQLPGTITAVQPTPFGQNIIATTLQSYRQIPGVTPSALPYVSNAADITIVGNEAILYGPNIISGVNSQEAWFRNAAFAASMIPTGHAGRIQTSASGKVYMMSRMNIQVINSVNFVDDGANSFNRKELDINQVQALYLNGGDMFWDRGATNNARYNVPKVTDSLMPKKHSLFAMSPWIGGMHSGQLYQSAQTYRQSSVGGISYRSGPLDSLGERLPQEADYDRLWKINRLEVELFKYAWQQGTVQNGYYVPRSDFREWPGNRPGGGVLAPYHDENGDGIYRWQDGDYPLIKGDQAIWMVFNDRDPRRTLELPALGLEVHCMAYAYVCDSASGLDSVINYTTFLDYKVINRSNRTYSDTYISIWADGDVGNPTDDYVGMDVQGNGFYFYNGDDDDEGIQGYGLNPPAQGIYQLKGPLAPVGDGIDNNRNGQIDEAGEDVAFSRFIYYNNDGLPNGNPTTAAHFHNYARGIWKDNTPMVFGGSGYPGTMGSTTTPANFMFPASSDPTGWGIGGNTQSPVSAPFNWSELNPGPGTSANVPSDRRGMAAMGPFNMGSGETQSMTLALIWSRGSNGAQSSVQKLLTQDAPLIKQWHAQNTFPSCLDLSTVNVRPLTKPALQAKLYPNPAQSRVHVAFERAEPAEVQFFDMQGRLVFSTLLEAGYQHELNIERLSPGIYLVQLRQNEAIKQLRMVKH